MGALAISASQNARIGGICFRSGLPESRTGDLEPLDWQGWSPSMGRSDEPPIPRCLPQRVPADVRVGGIRVSVPDHSDRRRGPFATRNRQTASLSKSAMATKLWGCTHCSSSKVSPS
jgi:hypothetical protein